MAQLVKDCYLDEDTIVAAQRFRSSEEFRAVAAMLGASGKRKLRILDLGCGNGIASFAFASEGHQVAAVDPDESETVGLGSLRHLRPLLSEGSITVTRAFAEDLPFENEAFDVLYARQALHHFADLSAGLRECSRVLKPNGWFLATREHVVSDPTQLAVFLKHHPLHAIHGGERAYPLCDYLQALTGAGLDPCRILGPYDSVVNHFPLSDAEMRQRVRAALARRLGPSVAAAVSRAPIVERMVRNRWSQACSDPGRLYSFLCRRSRMPE